MEIKYKNLVADFTYQNDSDFLGSTDIVIKNSDIREMSEDNDWNSEQLPYYDEDVFKDWFEENPDEDYASNNADFHIVFFNWALSKDREVSFQYFATNPMWMLHDIDHAENDVTGTEVETDQWREERAVFNSMEIAQPIGLIACFTVEIFNIFNNAFQERFEVDFPVQDAIDKLNELSNY